VILAHTMDIPEVNTERLTLRGLREEDFEAYAAMAAHPDVARELSSGEPLSREDAWRQLAAMVGHWALRGYGNWAVVETASGTFLGRAGLWKPEGWPEIEAGWSLLPEHWGHGYATEAARASLRWAHEELGIRFVMSFIKPDNVRSIAVAERLGGLASGFIEIRGEYCLQYTLSCRQAEPGRG
jgi:RimJ/RimL family protein N-acetyltransferase